MEVLLSLGFPLSGIYRGMWLESQKPELRGNYE